MLKKKPGGKAGQRTKFEGVQAFPAPAYLDSPTSGYVQHKHLAELSEQEEGEAGERSDIQRVPLITA